MAIHLQSVITCPKCDFSKEEMMPTDSCQFFYKCSQCGTVSRPHTGDCCVYCSYGSIQFLPEQAKRK